MGFLIENPNAVGFLNVLDIMDLFSEYSVFCNSFIDIEFEVASALLDPQSLSFLLFNF